MTFLVFPKLKCLVPTFLINFPDFDFETSPSKQKWRISSLILLPTLFERLQVVDVSGGREMGVERRMERT